MRKLLPFVLLLAAGLSSARAELNGDGYYRVQNYGTGRYVYVIDNKGEVDYATTSIDLAALRLKQNFDNAIGDPASIIYIKHISGREYDLLAQGESVYAFLGLYPRIDGHKTLSEAYYIYGTKDGMSKRLGDGYLDNSIEVGSMVTTATGNNLLWKLLPVTTADDQCFGVRPTVTVGGAYYSSLYCGFPYTFVADGMTAYCVTAVGYGLAAYEPLPAGQVPAGTGVFIRCAAATPLGNKLNVGAATTAAPAGNLLRGAYFCNSGYKHINRVAYDKATMRVLGVTADGALGYVTADYDYVPANTSYLVVPQGTAAELRLVTRAEYDAEEEYQKYLASVERLDAAAMTVATDGTTLRIGGLADGIVVTVLTPSGRVVYQGRDHEIRLAARGVYVVKAAGSTVKVVM